MKTFIDSIVDAKLKLIRMDDNRITVITSGIFGAYHYKVGRLEFEEITVIRAPRRGGVYRWIMRKDGKETRLKFKYVVYLTLKELNLLN